MLNERIERMISFAYAQLEKHYRWGGNGPNNFDCSGLVLACLKVSNFFPSDVDTTAQDIYFYLSNQNWIEKKCRGAICFFGKRRDRITHIGIMVDDNNFIGANGGNSLTISDEIAIKMNAKVDIRPLRRDLIAYLYPNN